MNASISYPLTDLVSLRAGDMFMLLCIRPFTCVFAHLFFTHNLFEEKKNRKKNKKTTTKNRLIVKEKTTIKSGESIYSFIP